MSLFFKIALVPTLLTGLTLFGMNATGLSRRSPSPIAMTGAPFEHADAAFLADGLSIPN
ncbi:hypothetical protein [Methylocapsa palsarum]|uniref:Uncharacterized protein n=1 Tax=Methylocapsa palsarum TaxID=1612308 RepID=A0A1I3XY89_9HYPH|nr:hypothetical protein [Methylocapsa palsarum]SFK24021.1 hypothetical protein SAMN05444581_104140 [Methylocapsa palsarum]